MKRLLVVLIICGVNENVWAQSTAPDLDFTVNYYNRVLTPEGLTREASYSDFVLRRNNHVVQTRVLLPESRLATNKSVEEHQHKSLNYTLLPRHVYKKKEQLYVEFLDFKNKDQIAIKPNDYDLVDFDGSWDNAFYIIDPKTVAQMPITQRQSPVASARWHERENGRVFQKVLWDDARQIPLLIESGDVNRTFFRRIEITPKTSLSSENIWLQVKGFSQKEYSDFLD